MEKETTTPLVESDTTTTTTTTPQTLSIKECAHRLQEVYDAKIGMALAEFDIRHIEKATNLEGYDNRMFRTSVPCVIRTREDTPCPLKECELTLPPPLDGPDGATTMTESSRSLRKGLLVDLRVPEESVAREPSEDFVTSEIDSQVLVCLQKTIRDVYWYLDECTRCGRSAKVIDSFAYRTTCCAITPKIEFRVVSDKERASKMSVMRVSTSNFIFTVDFTCYTAVSVPDVLRWYTDSVIHALSSNHTVKRIVHGIVEDANRSMNFYNLFLKLDSRTWASSVLRGNAFNVHFDTLMNRMKKDGSTIYFNATAQLANEDRLLVVACVFSRYDTQPVKPLVYSNVHPGLREYVFIRDVVKLEAAIGREELRVLPCRTNHATTTPPSNAFRVCLLCRRDGDSGDTAVALCNDVMPTIRSCLSSGYKAVQMEFKPMPEHTRSVHPDAYPSFQCHLTLTKEAVMMTEEDKHKRLAEQTVDVEKTDRSQNEPPVAGSDVELHESRVIVIEDGHCGGTIHGL